MIISCTQLDLAVHPCFFIAYVIGRLSLIEMEKVIITGYTAKKEGVILETNIPARLKPNRMLSKETFVSWDKIGKLLFEDYTDLEGVASRDSIRNNSSLKEEVEKQYCMPEAKFKRRA
jgi:hypothetical protein